MSEPTDREGPTGEAEVAERAELYQQDEYEQHEDQERSEMSVETPEGDAVEQRAALTDEDRGDQPEWPRHLPFDANEADAADQERPVHLDEDDYR
jgi:hypothetical protein